MIEGGPSLDALHCMQSSRCCPSPPSSFHVIDTSTPQTLERDFYAWLHSSTMEDEKSLTHLSFSALSVQHHRQLQIHHDSSVEAMGVNEEVLYSPLPSIQFVAFRGRTPNHNTELPLHPCVESSHASTSGSYPTTTMTHSLPAEVPNEDSGYATAEESPDTYLEGCATSSPSDSSSSSTVSYPSASSPSIEDAASRSSGRNQLGRTYSPGLPLSMRERQYIVQLFQSGWKICDISRRLCVTHSCVSKILNRYRQTGSVKPKEAKEGRTESPLVTAIRDYRARLGMSRQSEIREQLIADGICTRETAPSRSSINHILRTKLDIMNKKRRDRRPLSIG